MRRVGDYPLWIGTARDARDLRAVLDAGIEAIVDLAVNEPPAVLSRELAYLRFPLVDGSGNPPWLLRGAVHTLSELIRQRVPTLVACGVGMSRSLAITAAAAFCSELWKGSAAQVLEAIRANGPADLHPLLWEDVSRHALTFPKIR